MKDKNEKNYIDSVGYDNKRAVDNQYRAALRDILENGEDQETRLQIEDNR